MVRLERTRARSAPSSPAYVVAKADNSPSCGASTHLHRLTASHAYRTLPRGDGWASRARCRSSAAAARASSAPSTSGSPAEASVASCAPGSTMPGPYLGVLSTAPRLTAGPPPAGGRPCRPTRGSGQAQLGHHVVEPHDLLIQERVELAAAEIGIGPTVA